MSINAFNEIFQVTSQDLAYFRRGELSPTAQAQAAQTEQGCNRWLKIIIFLCILCIGGIYLASEGDTGAFVGRSAIFFILGVGALLVLILGGRVMTSPQASVVHKVSGEARVSVSYHEGSKRYILLVDKVDFSLTQQMFEAIPHGEDIIVYYQRFGPKFHKILAIEANT